jgi:hypothetical protein
LSLFRPWAKVANKVKKTRKAFNKGKTGGKRNSAVLMGGSMIAGRNRGIELDIHI